MSAAIDLDLNALDVCLLNGRRYVQGTQMVARACDRLGLVPATLLAAKFIRLTDRQVFVRLAPAATPPLASLVGSVTLRQGRQLLELEFHEGQQTAPAVSRSTALQILDLNHDGRLSGSYVCEGALALEGVLDALVQGIKRIHQGLPQPVDDVWFTGLRQFELPTLGLSQQGRGQVDVKCLRVLGGPHRQQSLLKVSLTLPDRPQPLDGLVTFAYQNTGGDHVH